VSPDARRYLTALAVVLVLGGAGEALRLSRPREAHYQPDFAAVPLRIGDYQGRDLPVSESIYRFLAAGGMLEREYEGPAGAVRLTIIYAADWRSVHSPTGCYPAVGWEVLEDRPVDFLAPGGASAEPLHARLLRVRKGDQERLAAFSFAYQGGTTADWALMTLRVALGPRGAGGLVFTLSTPNDPGALARLGEIYAAAYPAAIGFWNQGK
jgi:hypothetical protein